MKYIIEVDVNRPKDDLLEFILDTTKLMEDFRKDAKEYVKDRGFDEQLFTRKKPFKLKLGYVKLKVLPTSIKNGTDDFLKDLRRKENRAWDGSDEMNLNKIRYENPNMKYTKRMITAEGRINE
jgi:hypothetical protein